MSHYRLIAFDLVGTLIFPDPPVANVYVNAAKDHGHGRDVDVIKARFKDAFRRARFAGGSDIEHKGLWRAIVEDVLQLEPEACAPVFDQLWDHFGRAASWAFFDDVQPTLAALHARQQSFVIASNFDARIESILKGLHLWQEGKVFWSSALRASKPDRQFYQAIEAATGCVGREFLFVGDDWVNDYQGALNSGWNAIMIDRNHRGGHQSTKIGSLHELLTLSSPCPNSNS